MTLKKYLTLMSFVGILCWIGFSAVITYINPLESGMLGFALFYGILFMAVMATLSVFGFILRSRLLKGELVFAQVAITFRQAFWFGLLVTISLWLQARNLLTIWNALLLIMALTVFEFFFLSLKKQKL